MLHRMKSYMEIYDIFNLRVFLYLCYSISLVAHRKKKLDRCVVPGIFLVSNHIQKVSFFKS